MRADLEGLVGAETADVGSVDFGSLMLLRFVALPYLLMYLVPKAEAEELAMSGCTSLHKQRLHALFIEALEQLGDCLGMAVVDNAQRVGTAVMACGKGRAVHHVSAPPHEDSLMSRPEMVGMPQGGWGRDCYSLKFEI